jgi:putative membrane protein
VERDQLDYRFTLGNERTFLAWIRTAPALVAGGIVAAKALEFNHDVWRWIIAVPPVLAGATMAGRATVRWREHEEAMRAGRPLPVGRGLRLGGGVALCVYAVLALLASALDR